MTFFQKGLLGAILLFSALLVDIYSAMTPVGKSPDERHHFAYAYGIYEQGLTPFFDRKAILTDGKDPNHLRHPPGYYFILASAMALLDIDKDFSGNGLSSTQYSGSLKNAAIQPLRAISLALYAVHLLGLYLLVNYLVRRKLVSGWAAVAATALVVFIPSRMHLAGAVNNDTLAMAVWPFLALYGTKTLLEPSLATLLKFAIAATVAALTKLTLAIVVLPFAGAIMLFQLLRFDPLGFQPQLRFWWYEIRRSRLREAGLFAVFAVLFVFAAAYYGNTYAKFGSVNPTYTQIYNLPDEDNKFRVERTKERSWGAIAEDVVVSSWRTTTGAFGHEHLYVDANVTTELVLVTLAFLLALGAVVLSWIYRKNSDLRRLLIPLVYLAVPPLFWLIWINWNVGNYALNGRLGTQGRYTIGALEVGILGVFLAWGALQASGVGRLRLIGTVGASAVFIMLAPVFIKPLFYARMNEHLYFAANMPSLVAKNLASDGFSKITLKAAEPSGFVKTGYMESSRRTLHKDYFILSPNQARVIGAVPKIDTAKFKGLEVAVWARAGSRPSELQLSLRDIAGTTEPASEVLKLSGHISVTSHCFSIPQPELAISIRRVDPDYSLLTRLFKNDNPPILLGAYAKPVAECK
ncbi:glycosyltransferase family 39 protein [Oryzicola mucosus]|uniref:Glycosyltransferase family 39 protein n=1 Tax=Oryzicola mucosus TaxID=2767425 RepID=A0A8J6PMA1_9HYPH|nr:glycosyltransferase family 39 protein [Oryzicola mucosus]MBD0414202.1 glycosyltransferase family 39 protein [Oryzicola mucosus]